MQRSLIESSLLDGLRNGWPSALKVDSLVLSAREALGWRRMLETGVHATIGEIAAAARVNPSYARVLRLTDIVEAILDGRQGPDVTLEGLRRPFPVKWERQRGRGGSRIG